MNSSSRRFTEVVLSLVCIVYFGVNCVWVLPESSERTAILSPFRQTWQFFGLHQNWRLFSPIIRDINFHPVGIITFADGFKQVWEPPRLDKSDAMSRLRNDKFRKWSIDGLPWPDHKEYWPDVARYIGHQYYRQENPPTEFTLLLFWTPIPPPHVLVHRNQLPAHSIPNHVFTYQYSEGDFR